MDYSFRDSEDIFINTYDDPDEGITVLQKINDTFWEIHKGAFLKSQIRFFTSISNDNTDSSARRVVFGKTSIGISNSMSFYITRHNPYYEDLIYGKNQSGEYKTVHLNNFTFGTDYELVIKPDSFVNYTRSYPWNGERFIFKFMYSVAGAWSKNIEGYRCMNMYEYVRNPDGFEYYGIQDDTIEGNGIISPFDAEQMNLDRPGSRYDTGYEEFYMENKPEYYKLMKDDGLMSYGRFSMDTYNTGYLIDAYTLSNSNDVRVNLYESENYHEIEDKGTHIKIRGIILTNPSPYSIAECVDYDTYSKNIDYEQYIYDGCLYIEDIMIGNVSGDTLEIVCKFNKNGVLSDYVVITFSSYFSFLLDIILLADFESVTGMNNDEIYG